MLSMDAPEIRTRTDANPVDFAQYLSGGIASVHGIFHEHVVPESATDDAGPLPFVLRLAIECSDHDAGVQHPTYGVFPSRGLHRILYL